MSEGTADGPLPARTPGPDASDDDRDRVVARLREAVGQGQIDLDELERRLTAVYSASTLPELSQLTTDLPVLPPQSAAPSSTSGPGFAGLDLPALRNGGFQHHLMVYILTIGMLIGIWAITGFGHPWPFYPAAGWGIGLGSHFLAANKGQTDRERHALRDADRHQRRADQLQRRADRVDERAHDRSQRSIPPSRPQSPGPDRSADAPPPSGTRSSVERRYVAAMFVDVVGSTGLNETLGDEGWARVRSHLRDLLHECFDSEGGEEVSVAGDGVLARFDTPAGAARAAIEVQRRLERQRETTGFAPSVRIGIHSGDVVDDGGDVIGSVVNLASRVTGAAEPDEIMVTEHVADHLPSPLHTVDRGIHTLKGVSRPRHLLTLRWR